MNARPDTTPHGPPPAASAPPRRHWRRLLAWSVAGLALAAVFAAYLSPDMAVTLANFVWSCFGG